MRGNMSLLGRPRCASNFFLFKTSLWDVCGFFFIFNLWIIHSIDWPIIVNKNHLESFLSQFSLLLIFGFAWEREKNYKSK